MIPSSYFQIKEPSRQLGHDPVNSSLICKHLSHHASHPACPLTLPHILESALTPPLPINWPFENYLQFYSFSGCSFIPSLVWYPAIQPTIVTASLFSLDLSSPSSRMPEKLMLLSSARLTCLLPFPDRKFVPVTSNATDWTSCSVGHAYMRDSLVWSHSSNFIPHFSALHTKMHLHCTNTLHTHTHTCMLIHTCIYMYTLAHIYSDTHTSQI